MKAMQGFSTDTRPSLESIRAVPKKTKAEKLLKKAEKAMKKAEKLSAKAAKKAAKAAGNAAAAVTTVSDITATAPAAFASSLKEQMDAVAGNRH